MIGNIEITIDGNNVEDYLIQYTRSKAICSGEHTAEIILADYTTTINTWDTVIIYEQGSKRATLFVETVERKDDKEVIINCKDGSKRLSDYYDENINTYSEPTSSRSILESYLTLAGVSYSFLDSSSDELVPEDSSFGPDNVLSIILPLLTMNGWFLMFNENNVAIIDRITFEPESPSLTLDDTDVLRILTNKNDDDARNRVVVWNPAKNVATEVRVTTDWMTHSNDFRSVLVSNSWIRNDYHAWKIASYILNQFRESEFVKIVETPGSPNIDTGDTVRVSSDFYTGRGIVTALSVNASANGWFTSLTLDEKCPRMVGNYDLIGHVYIGTWGSGVWRKLLEQTTWVNYSTGLGNLYINDLFVNNGALVCVADNGFAYLRDISESSWRVVNHGSFNDGLVIHPQEDVFATACTIDKTTSDIYVTYVYDGGAGNYHSWVAKMDLFGTISERVHIETSTIDQFYAYDIDRNNNNNFLSSFSQVTSSERDVLRTWEITRPEYEEDTRYEAPQSFSFQAPNTDVSLDDIFAETITGYPEFLGTTLYSNWVIEDNYLFCVGQEKLMMVDVSTVPATKAFYSITMDTSPSDETPNGYIYLYKEKDSPVFDIIILKPSGSSPPNIRKDFYVTSHKRFTFDEYFGNLLIVNDFGSTQVTNYFDSGGELTSVFNTSPFKQPIMVENKIYCIWSLKVDGVYNIYTAGYNINTGSLTSNTITSAEIVELIDPYPRWTLNSEGRLNIYSPVLTNNGYGGQRQVWFPVAGVFRNYAFVGFAVFDHYLNSPVSDSRMEITETIWPDFNWHGVGPWYLGDATFNPDGGIYCRYLSNNKTDSKTWFAYYLNLIVEYDDAVPCLIGVPPITYYVWERDYDEVSKWGVVELPSNTQIYEDMDEWVYGPCAYPTAFWFPMKHWLTINERHPDDITWRQTFLNKLRIPFINVKSDDSYFFTRDPYQIWDAKLGADGYLRDFPSEVTDNTGLTESENIVVLHQQDSREGLVGAYSSKDAFYTPANAGMLHFFDPSTSNVEITVSGSEGSNSTINTTYNTVMNKGAYLFSYNGRYPIAYIVDPDQWYVTVSLNNILKQDTGNNFTVIEESTRERLVENSLDNPLVVYSTPSGYLPSGYLISTELPYTVTYDTLYDSIYYAYLEAPNSAKVLDIVNISGFQTNPSGIFLPSGGELIPGRYTIVSSGSNIIIRGTYIPDYNSTLATFEGYIVNQLETTNNSNPPYIFASLTQGSGQTFMQKYFDNYEFTEHAVGLPSGLITIIRADDIL